MRKPRNNYTAEEKVAILKRHLVEKTPVSDLCDELSLRPSILYNWQKRFFENGTTAFQGGRRASAVSQESRRLIQLEAKLALKNETLAELAQEYVQLKLKLENLN